MESEIKKKINIRSSGDVFTARQEAKTFAKHAGFPDQDCEEISLVVNELATNLIKHANGGIILFQVIENNYKSGIQIESLDWGPGILNKERAITDGFSTSGSLGYGLGTVNRLMEEMEINTRNKIGQGTHIVCKRWNHAFKPINKSIPLEFGVSTRPHPGMNLNGDAFVIKKWEENALVAVIDGLGHGQYAHRASQKAKEYIENHFMQSLKDIFRGVGRNCYATRGVVMAIVHIKWNLQKFSFASIGNIEARIFNSPEKFNFVLRRGIVGLNAPNPVVTEHIWHPGNIMILHSDGLRTHWDWRDFPYLQQKPAQEIAGGLLRNLSKDTDDATIVVIKEKKNG